MRDSGYELSFLTCMLAPVLVALLLNSVGSCRAEVFKLHRSASGNGSVTGPILVCEAAWGLVQQILQRTVASCQFGSLCVVLIKCVTRERPETGAALADTALVVSQLPECADVATVSEADKCAFIRQYCQPGKPMGYSLQSGQVLFAPAWFVILPVLLDKC